jgi:hypothetical protein
MKLEETVQHLLGRFSESDESLVRWFLTNPNCYIDNRLPWRLRDRKRIESLFNRFLHPADEF